MMIQPLLTIPILRKGFMFQIIFWSMLESKGDYMSQGLCVLHI